MAIKDILTKGVSYGDIDLYKSRFDFEKFEIEEQDKATLLQKEQIITNSQKQMMKNIYEIAKNLYESQQILANYHSGSFVEWFSNLGFKKDDVYSMIDKFKLVQETNIKGAIDLPVRVVQNIKKLDIDVKQKIEIVKSENPRKKIEEFSHSEKSELSEMEILKIQLRYHTRKVKELKARMVLLENEED